MAMELWHSGGELPFTCGVRTALKIVLPCLPCQLAEFLESQVPKNGCRPRELVGRIESPRYRWVRRLGGGVIQEMLLVVIERCSRAHCLLANPFDYECKGDF